MGLIDIGIIVIILLFILLGFSFGLVHTLGSLVGTLVGIFFASRLVDPAFGAFGFLFGGGTFARILIFIILFFIISKLVGLVFWFVEKVFDVLAWIPFARSFDKLLGAAFGFLEGLIVVGVILFYAMQVLPDDALRSLLETSFLADFLIAGMSALQVFFPEASREVIESTPS